MIPSKYALLALLGLLAATPQAHADCETPAILSQCRMCHELVAGRPDRPTGPNISQIYGAKAMSEPAFSYSPAIKMAAEKGLVWTEENLFEYLADQHGFLAKFNGEELPNKMLIQTLKDEDRRKAVIAALKSVKECK